MTEPTFQLSHYYYRALLRLEFTRKSELREPHRIDEEENARRTRTRSLFKAGPRLARDHSRSKAQLDLTISIKSRVLLRFE